MKNPIKQIKEKLTKKKIRRLLNDTFLIFFSGMFLVMLILLGRVLFYSDQTYLNLPYESTVIAIEWNANSTSTKFSGLSSKMGLPNAVRFIDLEKIISESFKGLEFNPTSFDTKVFTLQKVENEIYPVMIYEFRDPSILGELNYFPGFAYYKTKNQLVISPSKQALLAIKNPQRKLKTVLSVHDAISNLPKFNIADFYINHSLITNNLLSGNLYLFQSFNQTLGITAGNLREVQTGLLLSTYTNPAPELTFPFTRRKYNPSIPSYIPSEQLLFLGGHSVASRTVEILQNLPQFKGSQEAVSTKLYSLLNTYNLSPDALRVLAKIFQNEFAFTLNYSLEPSMFFANLDSEIQLMLESELDNLTAFLNPRIVSYLLEDGQVGRQLVPNENISGQIITDGLKSYQLRELNNTLYLGFKTDTPFSFISTSTDPFSYLSLNPKSLSQDRFFANGINTLLPIADEILFVRKPLLYSFLQDRFDYKDIPTITSATNFFTDGIQTVTLLQW